jgi:hypothetical protein
MAKAKKEFPPKPNRKNLLKSLKRTWKNHQILNQIEEKINQL